MNLYIHIAYIFSQHFDLGLCCLLFNKRSQIRLNKL